MNANTEQLKRTLIMYWQKHYITRWWCTDVLCLAAIFFAVVFVLGSASHRMFVSADKHIKPDNSYQSVNLTNANESCTATLSEEGLLAALLRPYKTKKAVDISADVLQEIFTLQESGKWQQANALLESVPHKNLLRGHILAQRYLHKDYTSTADELIAWLDHYNDHPQAEAIYALAVRKSANSNGITTPIRSKTLTGAAYNTQTARRNQYQEWSAGLEAWRKKDYGNAYKNFVALAGHEDTQLQHWDRAAGHFWAYRAATRLGNKLSANRHLVAASKHQGSFYGIQASFALGKRLNLESAKYSEDAVNAVTASFPPAQRAYDLIRAKQFSLAADEIRHAYYRADDNEKYALLALTQKLNMPAVQIRLASQLHYRRNHEHLNPALYPTPGWEPHQGYAVDPALVFAVARQESGFDDSVRSSAGAQGVMQIMPETANYIMKRIDPKLHKRLAEESSPKLIRNLAMGQAYLRYLLEKPYVDNNLVYMAIAYNAGAANLLKWKKSIDQSDPLLFVESLPYWETRDYIHNVLANFWIYQEIMGYKRIQPPMLTATQWPIYVYNKQQLARANAYIGRKQAALNTL